MRGVVQRGKDSSQGVSPLQAVGEQQHGCQAHSELLPLSCMDARQPLRACAGRPPVCIVVEVVLQQRPHQADRAGPVGQRQRAEQARRVHEGAKRRRQPRQLLEHGRLHLQCTSACTWMQGCVPHTHSRARQQAVRPAVLLAVLTTSPCGLQNLLRVNGVNGSGMPSSATSAWMLAYCNGTRIPGVQARSRHASAPNAAMLCQRSHAVPPAAAAAPHLEPKALDAGLHELARRRRESTAQSACVHPIAP